MTDDKSQMTDGSLAQSRLQPTCARSEFASSGLENSERKRALNYASRISAPKWRLHETANRPRHDTRSARLLREVASEIDVMITPEIEAAACARFKIPPAAWEEAKKLFPRLLRKVNQKRLRRIDYALDTGKLPPTGWTPPDPKNRSTQNVPPYASFWKHEHLCR